MLEPKMTQVAEASSLYNQDIVLWVEDTVSKLKARDFTNLDLENLIEEVEDLGKSQRHAVRSLLRRLIEHLLKRAYVPLPECYVGWQQEIRAFRNDIKDILDDSPSLKNFLSEILPQVSAKTVAAMREDYPQVDFPEYWTDRLDVNDILNVNFWEHPEP
jgi:hypothetical protein